MFSVSTLSTLKYLQKETHYLNDSTENFAFSAFQDQIFFLSLYCLGSSQGQTKRSGGAESDTLAGMPAALQSLN